MILKFGENIFTKIFDLNYQNDYFSLLRLRESRLPFSYKYSSQKFTHFPLILEQKLNRFIKLFFVQ